VSGSGKHGDFLKKRFKKSKNYAKPAAEIPNCISYIRNKKKRADLFLFLLFK